MRFTQRLSRGSYDVFGQSYHWQVIGVLLSTCRLCLSDIKQMESSAQYQIPEAGEEDVSDDEGHVSVSRCRRLPRYGDDPDDPGLRIAL